MFVSSIAPVSAGGTGHFIRSLAPRVRIARLTAPVLAAAMALAACKEAAEPAKAATIVGLSATDSVRFGKTKTFLVETRDASGKKVTGRQITWTSSNPNIAAVDGNGVVTGVNYGSAIIIARADDATSQTTLTVQQSVASVVLFPANGSVPIGSTANLTIAVTDANGAALLGRSVAFSTSNPSIATVNGNGTVLAVAIGRVTIQALVVLDGVTGTATVDVVQVPVSSIAISPPGGQTVFEGLTLQLAATTRDGSGSILNGRPISWTTSNQSIATVSSTGVVNGVSLGSATITAESEGRTATTQITVAPRPVAIVGLSAGSGSITVNQSLQLSLDLRDANGNQLTTTGRTMVWDSSNKPVATVQDGVVRGVAPGSATITVTVDGKPASTLVTVTP